MNARIFAIFILMLATVFLSSCGDIKDKQITPENREQIIEEIYKTGGLKQEEVGFFVRASARAAANNYSDFDGKTVREVINAQMVKEEAEALEKKLDKSIKEN